MEIRIPFSVICINDSDRPGDIPTSKWVKKGEYYTVIEVTKLLVQGGIIGFKLEELNIDDCVPYQYFLSHRFGIPIDVSYGVEEMLNTLLEEAKEDYKHDIETKF